MLAIDLSDDDDGVGSVDAIRTQGRASAASASADRIEGEEGPAGRRMQMRLFHRIIAIKSLYFKAMALEGDGRARDALTPYSQVTDFARRYDQDEGDHRYVATILSPTMAYLMAMAAYRYGLLCSLLARRPHLVQWPLGVTAVGALRNRLLYDAAVALWMFLTFCPDRFGPRRHRLAIELYTEALEGRFNRTNYRNTFDGNQFAIMRRLCKSEDMPPSVAPTRSASRGPRSRTAKEPPQSSLGRAGSGDNYQQLARDGDAFLPLRQGLSESTMFAPLTEAEDILCCTGLREALSTRMPSDPSEIQRGSQREAVKRALRRLLCHLRGDSDAAMAFCKSLFVRYAASAHTYGLVVLTAAASALSGEAFRAGQLYSEFGGQSPQVLLTFARTALMFSSKVSLARDLAEGLLERLEAASLEASQGGDGCLASGGGENDNFEEGTRLGDCSYLISSVKVTLILAHLRLSYRNASLADDASTTLSSDGGRKAHLARALALCQEILAGEPYNAAVLMYAAIAHCEGGNLREGERSIKRSLSLNGDNAIGWHLFALIKSAQGDYHACISICNNVMENAARPTIHVALLKAATLSYLGLWEEAGQLAGMLISSFTSPSGPVVRVATSVSGMTMTDTESRTASASHAEGNGGASAPATAGGGGNGGGRPGTGTVPIEPAVFRSRFYAESRPGSEGSSFPPPPSSSGGGLAQKGQRRGMTFEEHQREKFPMQIKTALLGRLLSSRGSQRGGDEEDAQVFPEQTIPASDYLEILEVEAVARAKAGSVLLGQRLWCTMADIYLGSGRTGDAALAQHEAHLLNECSAPSMAVKGRIAEQCCAYKDAIEFYQAGLLANDASSECLLGLAQCYDTMQREAAESATASPPAGPLDGDRRGGAQQRARSLTMGERASREPHPPGEDPLRAANGSRDCSDDAADCSPPLLDRAVDSIAYGSVLAVLARDQTNVDALILIAGIGGRIGLSPAKIAAFYEGALALDEFRPIEPFSAVLDHVIIAPLVMQQQ